MSITKIIFSLSLLISINALCQYPITIATERKGVSLRGLSIPNKNTIWASGSNGSIAKSVDGGAHFEWMVVEGYTNRDFRAIHAWNEREAIIVAIASPGIILKTIDGGKKWKKVYENMDSAMFLDAIHFKDGHGIVIGDPIYQIPFMLTSADYGDKWVEVESSYFKDTILNGESFFASSNSNLTSIALTSIANDAYFVSGGLNSRLWINGSPYALPIIQGNNSSGANSIDISPNLKNIIIVGGDYKKDTMSERNIVLYEINAKTKSSGNNYKMKPILTQINLINKPFGYKSSVKFFNNEIAVACGTSGIDISKDKGKSWTMISKESFHIVQTQPNTKKVFLAGKGGRIAYFNID